MVIHTGRHAPPIYAVTTRIRGFDHRGSYDGRYGGILYGTRCGQRVMNPIPGTLSFAVQMSRADQGDSSPEQTVTAVGLGPLTEAAARRTHVAPLADAFAG